MDRQKQRWQKSWLVSLRLVLVTAIGIGPAVPAFGLSLKDIPVQEPTNLHAFVKGAPGTPEAAAAKEKLVVLGKALYWDAQVGSDDVVACATCHFNAGADVRVTNQLNPGGIATGNPPSRVDDTDFGDSAQIGVPGPNMVQWGFGFGPNMQLLPGHFPLHLRANPSDPVKVTGAVSDETSGTIRDTNDIVSSQGVRKDDITSPFTDNVYNLNDANQRQVEPRNTPSVLNGGFGVDTFWDGRASFIFNGKNPFGFRDTESTVWKNVGGNREDVKIRIPFAGLASQAVGPPLSRLEMTGPHRMFPDLAAKLLDPEMTVLGLQVVHPDDSVLGPYAKASFLLGSSGDLDNVKGLKSQTAPGTDLTYLELIQGAFRDEWWNGGDAQVRENFSLFFGLAIQAYESTLITDETPFDRYAGTLSDVRGDGGAIPADPSALTAQELLGLDIFRGTNESGRNYNPFVIEVPEPPEPPGEIPAPKLPVGLVDGACLGCHVLPESTNHTQRIAGTIKTIVETDPITKEFLGVTFAPNLAPGGGSPTDLENVVVPAGLIEAMAMGVADPVDPDMLEPWRQSALVPGVYDLARTHDLSGNPVPDGDFFTHYELQTGTDFLAGFGLYDVGFYNAAVRPTGEDLSRANSAPPTNGFPNGLPFAYTMLAKLIRDGDITDPEIKKFVPPVGTGPAEAMLSRPLPNGQRVALLYGVPTININPATRGAFKVPNLRNQQYMGPYFHNGGMATLRQVLELYARGGDFPITNRREMDAGIIGVPGLRPGVVVPGEETPDPRFPGITQATSQERVDALIAFLTRGLTDQRVVLEQAPFDHPQLFVPEGATGRRLGENRLIELKAIGAAGAEQPISRFLDMDPRAGSDPTKLGKVSGTVVLDGTGERLEGILVTAHRKVNGTWETAGAAYTNEAGFYRLSAIVPGTYKIRFRDEIGTYRAESYDNAPYQLNQNSGTNVGVVADATTHNTNASLALFSPDTDHGTAGSAKPVSGDSVQNHTLGTGGTDWFRVAGRAGNTYVIETSGDEPIDTFIDVYSADGTTRVAADNDSGAASFSRVSYLAPVNGDLLVKVSASVPGAYTLSISALDKMPPTTTTSARPSYAGQATIGLAVTDDWAGVSRTEYSIDGGAWTAGSSVVVTALGRHTLNYRSVDKSGNVEVPKGVSFAVTDTTQLTSKLSVTKPKYNQRTTVSGVLKRGSNGAPLAGVPVFVLSSTNGKTWKTVATVATDAQGAVSASVLPRSATHYRLAHGAKPDFFGGQGSSSVKAMPQVSLSKPSGPSEARSGKAFTSTGFLKPKHASGSTQVRIKAYRWNGKKWVHKKTIKAKASNYRSFTKYTARLSLTKGTWRIRAHHPADSLNASTYTAYRKIKVQ